MPFLLPIPQVTALRDFRPNMNDFCSGDEEIVRRMSSGATEVFTAEHDEDKYDRFM
jgi:hypothetical protein